MNVSFKDVAVGKIAVLRDEKRIGTIYSVPGGWQYFESDVGPRFTVAPDLEKLKYSMEVIFGDKP